MLLQQGISTLLILKNRYATPTSGNISARAPFDGIGRPNRSSRTVATTPDCQLVRQQQLLTSLSRLQILDTVPEFKSSKEKDADL
jgi:hypothetical protein